MGFEWCGPPNGERHKNAGRCLFKDLEVGVLDVFLVAFLPGARLDGVECLVIASSGSGVVLVLAFATKRDKNQREIFEKKKKGRIQTSPAAWACR